MGGWWKVVGAAVLLLASMAAASAASASVRPPADRGAGSPAPGPGLPVDPPLQSACNIASPGEASCGAVQLLTPSQYWHPGPFAGALPGRRSGGGSTTVSAPTSGYYPIDLQGAYGLLSAESSMSIGGATIAIVDAYDDPNAASDLAAYRTAMSSVTDPNTDLSDAVIPPLCSTTVTSGCVTLTKVNETGGTTYPRANSGWAEEISLDLDMASAVCPRCDIVLVEASSNSLSDLATAVNEAKSFNPAVITNSYGGSESSSETSENAIYTAGAHTAITVATGDSGYGVEFPAASPGVTAVGGTTLTYSGTGSGLVWDAQSAWSDTGSGCSADEALPSWQDVAGVYTLSGDCDGRQVADLSADANPSTGVATYDTYGEGGWLVFGGTSVSTQIVGAIYALAAGTGSGSYEPSPSALYPDATSGASGPTPGVEPVSSGSNGSCTALYLCNAADSLSSGYNGPTGLGTPQGIGAFVTSTSGSGGSLSLSPSSEALTAGVASGPITVTLSSSAASAVTVSLSTSSSSGVISTGNGSGSSTTLTIPAGSSTGTFNYEDTKAGSATITASASGYGSATLAVTTAAGALANLSVSPSSASLATGATQTFTVSGADAYGNPVTVDASWTATGGTVSPASGSSTTFTAGTTAGTFSVTAAASGYSASATVTVTSAPAMKVTVAAGALRERADTYSLPLTVAASSASSGAAISGAKVTLQVYSGAVCSGSPAASASGTTARNGEAGFTFSTPTAGSWCALATVTASGYRQGSGESTFST